MKTIQILLIGAALVIMSSCKSHKEISTGTSLEGEKVNIETRAYSGITDSKALNEDGTGTIEIPFKWYMGTAEVSDKQLAIKAAQSEAYNTISRTISNIVKDKIEYGALANNGAATIALRDYWMNLSLSIQKGAEPFGETVVSYDPKTKMYDATAKVGIRGDKYNSFLKNAANFKPDNLSQEELNDFIKINDDIIKAAKGE
jgi:hypothetical protein